ncbi:Unknown protein [Striga hermonthica]|uniref:Retrovirus-related Pol polyprotein from transposon TNT 1-94 n=1 Tax=Striga hermonthica TaxID=68872 RepID=A0A9N7NST2_STRHE|nr:Unknown protein [Striga hermonthica]
MKSAKPVNTPLANHFKLSKRSSPTSQEEKEAMASVPYSSDIAHAVGVVSSQSALDLSKNVMYHSRTKHIDVRYHWLRQVVEEQQFNLEKIRTDENPADMMTKVVTGGKLQLCAELIGMEYM